jgi:hypothetical protein
MPTIVATKDYPYGTRKLKVGDRFEATERDAELLVKVGMAKTEAPAAAESGPAEPVATDVTSEAPKPKRRYRRKDLQAEE